MSEKRLFHEEAAQSRSRHSDIRWLERLLQMKDVERRQHPYLLHWRTCSNLAVQVVNGKSRKRSRSGRHDRRQDSQSILFENMRKHVKILYRISDRL